MFQLWSIKSGRNGQRFHLFSNCRHINGLKNAADVVGDVTMAEAEKLFRQGRLCKHCTNVGLDCGDNPNQVTLQNALRGVLAIDLYSDAYFATGATDAVPRDSPT